MSHTAPLSIRRSALYPAAFVEAMVSIRTARTYDLETPAVMGEQAMPDARQRSKDRTSGAPGAGTEERVDTVVIVTSRVHIVTCGSVIYAPQ